MTLPLITGILSGGGGGLKKASWNFSPDFAPQ
jgi:hypothetical protein